MGTDEEEETDQACKRCTHWRPNQGPHVRSCDLHGLTGPDWGEDCDDYREITEH